VQRTRSPGAGIQPMVHGSPPNGSSQRPHAATLCCGEWAEHEKPRTGVAMIRGVFAAATTVTFAVGTAIAANADPPSGEVDVPGMVYNAVVGGPCSNFNGYIFGRGPDGQALACVAFAGDSGQWVPSAPLRGVQRVGAPCAGDGAAQSQDGRPLVCVVNQGWQPGP
jgi:hypothetical protein